MNQMSVHWAPRVNTWLRTRGGYSAYSTRMCGELHGMVDRQYSGKSHGQSHLSAEYGIYSRWIRHAFIQPAGPHVGY